MVFTISFLQKLTKMPRNHIANDHNGPGVPIPHTFAVEFAAVAFLFFLYTYTLTGCSFKNAN